MIARLLVFFHCTLSVLCKHHSAKQRRGCWACREQEQASALRAAAGGGRAQPGGGGDGQGVRRECCQRLAVWLVACGRLQAACGSPCKTGSVREPPTLRPRCRPQHTPQRGLSQAAGRSLWSCCAFLPVSPVRLQAGLAVQGAHTATAQETNPQRWHRWPCSAPRRCEDC